MGTSKIYTKYQRDLSELGKIDDTEGNKVEIVDSVYVINLSSKYLYRLDGQRSDIKTYLAGVLKEGDEIMFGRDYVKREYGFRKNGIRVNQVISLMN